MTKPESQIVKEFVLRAISDDYEEIGRVVADVTEWGGERGIAVDRDRVVEALTGLIREELAEAFSFPGKPPWVAQSTPYSADHVGDLWFYVTPKGKQMAISLQEEWR